MNYGKIFLIDFLHCEMVQKLLHTLFNESSHYPTPPPSSNLLRCVRNTVPPTHRLNMELWISKVYMGSCAVPEIIDPVFAETSPKRSFSMTEYERFGLVFKKMRVYKFGHCTHWLRLPQPPPLSPSPRIWAHIRGRYWSAKIDDNSFSIPAPTFSEYFY